jgi:hypothetical protein
MYNILFEREHLMNKDKRIERQQGDVNTTENRRKFWERNLSGESNKWFEEGKKY